MKIQNIQNNVSKAISEKSYHFQNAETHNFKHRCPSKIAQKFSKYAKIATAGTIEITFNSNGSAINWLDFEEARFARKWQAGCHASFTTGPRTIFASHVTFLASKPLDIHDFGYPYRG